MSTVVLLSEEVEELRTHGEPHEGCSQSGTFRLIAIYQDAHLNIVGTEAAEAVFLHERLVCDDCGAWGPRIEDRGPADATWNQPVE